MNDSTKADQAPHDLVPCLFVYCGVRRLVGGKLGDCVMVLMADGSRPLHNYARTTKKVPRRLVGGVYEGASFSAEKARGLESARYVRRWDDPADVMRWEAEDGQVQFEVRSKKLEADAGRVGEIERLLLPLRQVFAGYRKRNDFAGMEALNAAVLRALHTPPRVIEQTK